MNASTRLVGPINFSQRNYQAGERTLRQSPRQPGTKTHKTLRQFALFAKRFPFVFRHLPLVTPFAGLSIASNHNILHRINEFIMQRRSIEAPFPAKLIEDLQTMGIEVHTLELEKATEKEVADRLPKPLYGLGGKGSAEQALLNRMAKELVNELRVETAET